MSNLLGTAYVDGDGDLLVSWGNGSVSWMQSASVDLDDRGDRAVTKELSSQEKPEHRFKVVFTEKDSLSASILWVDAVNTFGLPIDAVDAAEKVANLFDSRGIEIVSISYLGLTVQESRDLRTTYRRAGGRTRAVYAA